MVYFAVYLLVMAQKEKIYIFALRYSVCLSFSPFIAFYLLKELL